MALQQVNGTIHSLVKTEEEWLGISTVIPKNQWVYVQVQNEEGATEFYGKLGDGEHTFVDLPKAMLDPSEVRAIAQAVVDSKADQSALDETNANVETLSTKVDELNTSVEETQSSVSALESQYNAVLEQVETIGTEIEGTVKLSSETAQIIDSDIVLGEGHSLKGADEESLVRLATVDSSEEGTRSNGVQTELGNIVNHTNILSSDRPTVTLADKAEQLAFVSDIDASVSAELEQEITDRQEADQALEDKITELSTSTEESLALKANIADVYSKEEADGKFALTTALETKADKATTLAGYGITDAYNKADVDGKLALKLDTEVASTTYATKSELDAKVSSVYKYKGSVENESALPQEGNVVGDVYNVESDGSNYAWDGEKWDKLGGDVDLTAYLTKEEAGTTYAKKAEIPTKLPNPEALTVTVNNKSFVSYDGSTAVTQDLVMNAETIPLNADTSLTVAYGLEQVTPLVVQVPIRTLQDKVYDQETILGWFGQESVADIKQKIVRNVPVFVKYGIQLSGNPHYYKFPVDYCAFETANQIKMVFQGLNTKDDVVSKYEIIINLDGTVIEGNSNVKVTITSLENKPGASSYNELTDKPTINNVELSGNKTLENLGIQPAGEYLVSADIANKADKATTLAGYGIEDAYTKSQIDTSLSTKLSSQEASSTYATITSVEAKADKATTLAGYGITDAFTKNEVNTALGAKLDSATASTTYATVTTVNGIEEVIPEEASTENKLVDTNAMNTALADKADASDLGTMASKNADDYSTKAVADTLYAAKSVESTVSTLTTTVASKANTADVYTQTAANAKFALKTDVSTISGKIPEAASADNKLVDNTSMTSALALKANSADVYSKGDVDSKLSAKLDSSTATSTYATKSELNAKADADDVYTKDEVDTALGKKLDTTTATSTYATQTSLTSHTSNTENPHSVTKAQVGLGNVDNTSDANKPISTATQTALNLKANSADVYTKSQVNTELAKKLDSTTASSTYATKEELNSKVASVYKVKGSVANQAALPEESNEVGDVYNVEDTGINYVWTGEEWDALGGSVDFTNYYTKGDVDSKLADKANTADVYSKTVLDPMLEAKVDSADLGTMAYAETTDYSTKTVADTLYAPISLSATVAGKADKATTLEGYGITDAYTSSEVDAKLAEKASTADVEAIEEVVPETASTSNMLVDAASLQSKLNAKADSETVSQIQSTLLTKADKSEIPSKLPNPQSFILQMNGTQVATYDGSTAQTGNVVVNATTVPMSGEDETTVSEALALKANTADVYTQTAADGKFALKTDVSTISGKIPEAASADNKLVDKNAMNTALAGKANTSDLGTMASKNADDYSTTEEANALYAPASISTTIEGKADKAETLAGYGITDAYTKSQVNTELGKKLDSTTASSTYATQSSVSTISGKIPEAASTDNLLVDTNAMNTALAGKANKAEVYTKGEVDAKVSSVYKYKGSVANEAALPEDSNTTGDVYNVEDTGMNYAWDGTQWDKLGGTVDLSNYYTKSQVNTELGKKLDITTASSTYLTQTTASSTYATVQALNAKADASDVTSIEETIATYGTMATKNAADYSTKAVADTLYAPASLSGTVSSLTTTVSGKANASEVYTKTVADSTFATKTELGNKVDTSALGNATITIKVNGSSVGTFTTNQLANSEVDITVPTQTSQLTNNSKFVTGESVTGIKLFASKEEAQQASASNPTLMCLYPD